MEFHPPSVVDHINPSLWIDSRPLESTDYYTPITKKELLDPSYCTCLISELLGYYDTQTYIQLYEIAPPGEKKQYAAVSHYVGSCDGCLYGHYPGVPGDDGMTSQMDLVKAVLRPMILCDSYEEALADAKRLTTALWAENYHSELAYVKRMHAPLRKRLEEMGLLPACGI